MITGALVDISEGRSPRERLGFMAPRGEFRVQGDPAAPRIDPRSYVRYDAMVGAFEALDSAELVRLYRQLKPLFDEAYKSFGYGSSDFDPVLSRALASVQRTPTIAPRAELYPLGATRYEFAEPALEDLEPIQRQLLRMGPGNVARALAKLREIEALWRGNS